MKPPAPAPQPDQPPPFQRRLVLGALEWVGIPLLALLPALALMGQLGPSSSRATDTSAEGSHHVTLEVTHPDRVRHEGHAELKVSVRNVGPQNLEDLVVAIDERYLAGFTAEAIWPQPASIAGGRLQVPLPSLRAGEEQQISAQLQAGDWGRLRGAVEVIDAQRRPLVAAKFSTFILP